MSTQEIQRRLDAAEAMAEEACDLCDQAILRWHARDYAGFVWHLRQGIAMLGCAAVAFDTIANECERLTKS